MAYDDYILRSDALTALMTAKSLTPIARLEALNCILPIPAADVEPKREIVPWKVAGAFDDFHQCTKCGNMWPIFSTVEWAYCPTCGCRKFPEPPGEVDDGHMDV